MIKNVGVIGAGQMGNGIAHVFALHNYFVVLYDVSQAQLEKALMIIRENLQRQLKKGTIQQNQIDSTLKNIKTTTELDAVVDVDFCIEASPEDETLKLNLFSKLDSIVKKESILASNTSSISITKLAKNTTRSERIVGMHFFNPVPVMDLVEIVKGMTTSEETCNIVFNLAKNIGKVPVLTKDYPGFIVNRILVPMINDAIFAYYEGIASAEDIDKAMKLGTNQPMGPLTLADFVGLDTLLSVLNVFYENFKDSKYRPCPLLVKMVEAGYLGRKSGKGFYDYNNK
ncbi:MAG: 3-hydroxybutyryl-CoA dehydrogenase [Desulfurella sp.]|uniref:3-hydroxybutyryl-CoA dehydrogenase n=1 Tax=Desulfurella sp. TaxID=1962857 RepID=UPI000CC67803|nr:3-hydroxybutyryl-CoA dehydrogenase [Desulfurella sp.]PMP89295.1 MAG: 3-hydroxybutyryl-CoA dehydrogenase [Desulfurella sp.]